MEIAESQWQMTPTTRSRRLMERAGYVVDVGERTVTRGIKKDLFGIVDLVCIGGAGDVVWLQVTDGSHYANRVAKAIACEHLTRLANSGRLVVHGWRKSKRSGTWICRVATIWADGDVQHGEVEE